MGRVLIIIIGTVFNRFKAELHYVFDSRLLLNCVFYAKYTCTQKLEPYFFRAFCGFLGHNFSFFFSGTIFRFSGVNFRKYYRGKFSRSRSKFGFF